jgi:hypothetical protein
MAGTICLLLYSQLMVGTQLALNQYLLTKEWDNVPKTSPIVLFV